MFVGFPNKTRSRHLRTQSHSTTQRRAPAHNDPSCGAIHEVPPQSPFSKYGTLDISKVALLPSQKNYTKKPIAMVTNSAFSLSNRTSIVFLFFSPNARLKSQKAGVLSAF